MASACAASLALADAGVPIESHVRHSHAASRVEGSDGGSDADFARAQVAGISIGLVTEAADESESCEYEDEFGRIARHAILTDLTGLEDHYGDMDFKVAGTRAGVTALQLDVKLAGGVPLAMICEAVDAAASARAQVLDIMEVAAPLPPAGSAPQLKAIAPRIEIVNFEPVRRKDLIGPQGQTMREIESTFGCSLDLSTEGQVKIFCEDASRALDAKQLVQELVAEVIEGQTYVCTVLEIKDYGAIVQVLRNREGLLHISELAHAARSGPSLAPRDLLNLGDTLELKCIGVDHIGGWIKLSRKALLPPPAPAETENEEQMMGGEASPTNTVGEEDTDSWEAVRDATSSSDPVSEEPEEAAPPAEETPSKKSGIFTELSKLWNKK